ncbi:MAG TPA: hypothetical protein VMR74_06225 [Gammaproteobacteria bacterium]|nr:hypothetical protein [Gammaproteobacteria bacterium]
MVAGNQPAPESDLVLPNPFEIVSIRSVAAPGGAVGNDWYRYEICQGDNTIVGYRAGGLDKVTDAVELIVIRLNERRLQKRGRVHVVLGKAAGPAGRR